MQRRHIYGLLGLLMMVALMGSAMVAPSRPLIVGTEVPPTTTPHLALDLERVVIPQNRTSTGDFETWTNPGAPYRWNSYLPGHQFHGTSDMEQDEGTYSAVLESRTIDAYRSSSAAIYNNSISISLMNLTGRLSWFVDQNPNPDPGDNAFRVQIAVNDGGSTRYLNYYLSGSTTASNSSTSAYFNIGGPTSTWNTFSRNITADYLAAVGFPGTVDGDETITMIWLDAYAYIASTEVTRIYVDDIQLFNESVVYMGGYMGNGNFETDDLTQWYTNGDRSPSSLSRSTTAYRGIYSANLTLQMNGNFSSGYSYYGSADPGPARLSALNPGRVTAWWRLEEMSGLSSTEYTAIQLTCSNVTNTFYVYYYVGHGGVTPSLFNSSTNLFLNATQGMPSSTWTLLDRSPWDDAAAYFGTQEILITRIHLRIQGQTAGARMTVLYDDVQVEAAALNDLGYETQGAVGTPIHGYGTSTGTYSDFTVTAEAHDGDKAASLAVTNGDVSAPVQYVHYRPFTQATDTFVSFWWRLETYDETAGTYMYFQVTAGSYSMRYYLAATASDILTNTTFNVRYNMTGGNPVGVWTLFERSITRDYYDAFGSWPDTTISQIQLYAISTTGNSVEVLIDDLYLVDDLAPSISTPVHTPTTPVYGEIVAVSAEIEDEQIDTPLLYYRVNGGGLSSVPMTWQTGDTYEADIPGQAYDALVEYYVWANDSIGQTDQSPEGGGFLSYIVGDHTPPVISAVLQEPSTPESTEGVMVYVNVSDASSGIDTVDIWYRVNSGAWIMQAMTLDVAPTYTGTIPMQAYDAVVEYYINATDIAGTVGLDNNSGAFYTYSAVDTVDPVVAFTSPSDGATVNGTVSVEISASDPGSGIRNVALYLNGTLVMNFTNSPYTLGWNTTGLAAGNYTIEARAFDMAGNMESASIMVQLVSPVVTGVDPIFIIVVVGAVGGVGVIIVVVILLRRRSLPV